MKYIYAIILAGIVLSSCKKSSDSPSPSSQYYATALINGSQFTATNALVSTPSNYLVAISASTSDIAFTLAINNYAGIGTYGINDPSGYASSYTYAAHVPTGSVTVGIAYGTVIITAYSPNLIGSFNFTCTDSTKVTNGKFNLKGF